VLNSERQLNSQDNKVRRERWLPRTILLSNMWKGRPRALKIYINWCIAEWTSRVGKNGDHYNTGYTKFKVDMTKSQVAVGGARGKIFILLISVVS